MTKDELAALGERQLRNRYEAATLRYTRLLLDGAPNPIALARVEVDAALLGEEMDRRKLIAWDPKSR